MDDHAYIYRSICTLLWNVTSNLHIVFLIFIHWLLKTNKKYDVLMFPLWFHKAWLHAIVFFSVYDFHEFHLFSILISSSDEERASLKVAAIISKLKVVAIISKNADFPLLSSSVP